MAILAGVTMPSEGLSRAAAARAFTVFFSMAQAGFRAPQIGPTKVY